MGGEEEYMDVEYETLPDESSGGQPIRRRSTINRKWNALCFSIGGVVTALAMSFIFLAARSYYRPMTAQELAAQSWNDCGETSKEAMQRGCIMDPMLYAWVPPKCYFHELSSSLPQIFENRKYYQDKNMTVEIRPDELYNGVYEHIFTMQYHDEHCLFQWRKLQYAIEHKLPYVDTLALDYAHMKHCADMLAVAKEPDHGMGQEILLAFYHCHKTTW